MSGLDMIRAEYERVRSEEGWTPQHDDRHTKGEMALAAAAYAIPALHREEMPVKRGIFGDWLPCSLAEAEAFIPERLWPWAPSDWKPSDYRRDLVRAGALIAFELDRLERTRG